MLIEFKDYIAEIDDETISRMRQQAAWLYSTYFSSIDSIIQTTVEIIHDRVFPSHARSMQQWNTEPGALIVRPNLKPGIQVFRGQRNLTCKVHLSLTPK